MFILIHQNEKLKSVLIAAKFLYGHQQNGHGLLLAFFFSTITKYKPTNVGRIALERQTGGKTVDHAGIQTMDLMIPNRKHCPLGHQAFLVAMLQPTLF